MHKLYPLAAAATLVAAPAVVGRKRRNPGAGSIANLTHDHARAQNRRLDQDCLNITRQNLRAQKAGLPGDMRVSRRGRVIPC